jgi:hypothetical protein
VGRVIRLTRTIEYEYDSAEDMARDIACWSLRGTGRTWFPFNNRKRARSRITAIEDVGFDGPGTIVSREVADAEHEPKSMPVPFGRLYGEGGGDEELQP